MAVIKYLGNVVSLTYTPQRCIGCGMCVKVCSRAVFQLKGNKAVIIARDLCMECGACMQNCPADALNVETGDGCMRGIINDLLGREASCC
jgi:NAD-dependent dihydropyrimidine dehydrogenase PreA subunit